MDGRPWLRILVVVLGFLLLGVPVWSTTAGRTEGRGAPAVGKKVPEASLHVSVVFSQPPSSFELSTAGLVICRGTGPERRFSGEWNGALPKEGVDFLIKASWPAGSPESATRVRLSRDDAELADQTFWAEGTLVEAVTARGED